MEIKNGCERCLVSIKSERNTVTARSGTDSLTGGGRKEKEDFGLSPACLRQGRGSEGDSQVQPSAVLQALSPAGLWSWFLSTISHSNRIVVAPQTTAAACSTVWEHMIPSPLFSGPDSVLPTCPCPSPEQASSVASWAGGTVRESSPVTCELLRSSWPGWLWR